MKKLLLSLIMALSITSTEALAVDFNFDEMKYTPAETTFRLFAPSSAKRVVLRIYKDGQNGRAMKTVRMTAADTDSEGGAVWTTTVKGDLKGMFYTFDMGRGETPGTFAKAVGVNGQRAAIADLRQADPEGWMQDHGPVVKSPSDLIVYEMHHRDFSIARADARYPGKFMALTEPWAIQHLKELGVNAIHILPSYDYGSVDETRLSTPQYNWGYDPVNYNVPEGSYSTDPYEPLCRVKEFKQMVQALHKAGISVVLDVVYNHTYDIDRSNFQRTYPDYYYRKTADGNYSNGSGCGNETASERAMMRRFMIESVRHWIHEYHIDGFRFDLMGVHDIETMNAIRKAVDDIDPTIFIYGEGWSAGSCALPNEKLGMKANIPQMPGIAAFSDDIRDALRGPFSDDTKGAFLAGLPGMEESLKAGIAGMVEHPQVDYSKVNYSKQPYALQPTQMMALVSCHDDMCLVDRLKASIPALKKDTRAAEDELIRLDLLAQTAVFTSQGVPFMLSGEELLRSKKGVHNSFESPDSINQLEWTNKQRYSKVFDYYRNLIALRKHHPAFRLGSAELVRRHLEFLKTEDCLIAFRLKNYAGRDDWRNIIVILNANAEPRSVTVPKATYTVVCRNGKIDEKGLGTAGQDGHVEVDPQSALIIHD